LSLDRATDCRTKFYTEIRHTEELRKHQKRNRNHFTGIYNISL